jgi:hypothetical protein
MKKLFKRKKLILKYRIIAIIAKWLNCSDLIDYEVYNALIPAKKNTYTGKSIFYDPLSVLIKNKNIQIKPFRNYGENISFLSCISNEKHEKHWEKPKNITGIE